MTETEKNEKKDRLMLKMGEFWAQPVGIHFSVIFQFLLYYFSSIVYTYTLRGIFLDIALILEEFGKIVWNFGIPLCAFFFWIPSTCLILICFAKCVSNASAN